MERLKRTVTQIASTPDHRLHSLPLLHRALVPLLSLAASLYRLSLSLRRRLYLSGLLPKQRLPVPVISVGNLTWGGNGKTPMTEYIARFFAGIGIPPLILTRGYAGGDEAKMLQRHLVHTSARIGIGANRSAVAATIIEKYGYMDFSHTLSAERFSFRPHSENEEVGVVILDDGMQHWSLHRDLEIVLLNGLMPWGNSYLLPRGSLREPFSALDRADIAVVHHADLISDVQLKIIESTVQKVNAPIPIFFTRLAPAYFFDVKNPDSKLSLSMVHNLVLLCVSAIGFPDAFVQGVKKIGVFHVDRIDFSDHYFIQARDIDMIRERLKELEDEFKVKALIVVTEKDYYRDPVILKELSGSTVLVLCSSIQIMHVKYCTEENFQMSLKKLITKNHRDGA